MERIMFTKASVHALTPPAQGQRRTVYDLKHRRLAVRITSAGVRTFYVVKRSPPTVVWIKLGVFPEMTVEQARNEAQKVQGEFASGANPAAVKRAMKAEPTFADALDDYLKGKRKRDGTALADKTQRHYEVLAKDYLASIQGKKLSTIERNEIKAIPQRLRAQRAPGRYLSYLGLSSFLLYARCRAIHRAKPSRKNQKEPCSSA